MCLCLLVVVENVVVGLSTEEYQESTTSMSESTEESTSQSWEDTVPVRGGDDKKIKAVTEDSEEHSMPTGEDVDESESSTPVIENEELVDDDKEIEMPITHVTGETETDTGGSGVDSEDAVDDTLEISIPIRHNENATKSKEPVNEDLEQENGEVTDSVRDAENEDELMYEYGELQDFYDYESLSR